MPLIETKGAASAQGFGLTLGGAQPVYIEDVFSTYLYTGNGSTQTITNGINLSGKGGLVWIKGRSGATDHALYDTARGATKDLVSNSTAAETTQSTGLTAFNGTGFGVGALAKLNTNAATYASWTIREQSNFFDIVTYTGNGASNNTISHSLGSIPGFVIVKKTSGAAAWPVWHRTFTTDQFMLLNATNAVDIGTGVWGTSGFTSTSFSVGTSNSEWNQSGQTYVAYLFAHDAGGFGLSGTDNVISCGSYTADGTDKTISLGYEPQWVMVKRATNIGDWIMLDIMRSWSYGTESYLRANTSGAEDTGNTDGNPTATGFFIQGAGNLGVKYAGVNQTMIYIAIRRGPMKVPTSGTSVFAPRAQTGEAAFNNSFPVDLVMERDRTSGALGYTADRLRGGNLCLSTTSTAAEFSAGPAYFDSASGTFRATFVGGASPSVVYENFGRAPGFFDVVCYTGTGVARTVNHNLGVAPEMMIVKLRSNAGESWTVWNSTIAAANAANFLWLNSTSAIINNSGRFNSTAPTSTVFTVGTDVSTNNSGYTYVAYLFATCAGVSKVGSYTGTGALQTVNCGFTGGARFVLIKRTDSTGDWYVYDSARGISSGNDPYFLLNSSAAEVTGTNYVDTTSVGFQVTAAAPAGLNASGGSFIFFAVA